MKKIIAMILALCLLCGAVALAETTTLSGTNTTGETTVTYKIAPPPVTYDYILTIPSEVDLTNGSQTMEIKLDTTGVTGTDKQIIVDMNADTDSSGNWWLTLTNETGDVIRYQIKNSSDLNVYPAAASIMEWIPGTSPAAGLTETWTATVNESDLTDAAAGNYSDTLSFTVSMSSVQGGSGGGYAPDSDDSEFGN